MKVRVCLFGLALLAICLSGCTGSGSNTNTPAAGSPSAATTPGGSPVQPLAAESPGKILTAAGVKGACELLTGDEIRSVQGEAPKEAKPDDRLDGGFLISQCYFALPTLVNSVVLTVTRPANGAADPKDLWKRNFERGPEGREKERGERKEGREEEEEKAAPPQKVSGIGDEAFWVASRVGGAIYVLKQHSFIRISIGGADNQNTKLKKSKTLAQKVLAKL